MDLSSYTLKKPSTKKIDHGFQELGIEIAEHFGVKTTEFWWMFYKRSEQSIREAFSECKQDGFNFEKFKLIVMGKK